MHPRVQNYPGGPPHVQLERVVGHGDVWVAQLVTDYGTERWYVSSTFEFDGDRIARVTDYFGPSLPAPEWRIQYVDGGANAIDGDIAVG